MSVRKRLEKRIERNEELDKLQEVHLELGATIIGDNIFPFRDARHRRELWFSNRDRLIKNYMQRWPGRRPDGWWRYEAPEPRRLRDGREYEGPAGRPMRFGKPWYLPRDISWRDFETEAAYLDRHGLLTDAEREKIKDDPYAFDASIKFTAFK